MQSVDVDAIVAKAKAHALQARAKLTAPAPLRPLQAWLCWKREWDAKARRGQGAWRKVPHYANGGVRLGQHGRPEDRAQLVTFDAAAEAAARHAFDGVGFATLDTFGICAIDFDDCVVDGRVRADVLAAVEGTYAELSPSNNGVRAFVHGAFGNRKDHDYGIEVFSTAGFVTVTGNALPVVDLLDLRDTITDAPPALRALIAQRFGREEQPEAGDADARPLGVTSADLQRCLAALDPSMRHDPWLRIGMALHHETSGEGFHLWDEWSSNGAQYPGSAVLKSRWESFGRGGQRPVTVHALLKLARDAGVIVDLLANAADDFDVVDVAPVAAPAAGKPSRFRTLLPSELLALPPLAWLVKGVIPRAEVGTLFGPSGCGKSFVTLDLCAAIARGVTWRGLKVNRGRVVYVIGEGVKGFGQRLRAYALRAGLDGVDEIGVEVITAAPNLLKANAVDAREMAAQVGKADLIVIDTLARATPGANENAGEDMGKALDQCKTIHEATGAMVLLVHHTGKDASKGARGWSGIKGAMDVEIEVSRDKAGSGQVELTKSKDSLDGLAWGFRLDVVPLGFDEDGDQVSSCVVAEAVVPTRVAAFKPTGTWETAVWNVALNAVGAILQDDLIAAAVQATPKPEEGKDRRREYVRRALDGLIDKGQLTRDGDYVCVPQEAA